MRKLLVIGIGAGDPDQLTIQAVNALNTVDVFLVLDKGETTRELTELRQQILDRHVRDRDYRVVTITDPERDRSAVAYKAAVDDWRHRRADLCEAALRDEVTDGQTAAFLVWGDPALYDGTVAMVEDIAARGTVEFDYEVIPGISSVSALVARHRTTLNQVGGRVQITTGRRLQEGWPDRVDDVVVMLDARHAFTGYADQDVTIYWGAYVGMPDEILISGKLSEVADEIIAARAAAREHKGWIMDSYLLRRPS